MEKRDYNEELMDAVSSHNIEAVKYCLAQGADPNYTMIPDREYPDDVIQPTTPLKLVMFRISDSFLDDNDLKQFKEITKILLSLGADPKPAMQIAEGRYGRFDPECNETPFNEIWRLIVDAI